jgi:cytochrome c556
MIIRAFATFVAVAAIGVTAVVAQGDVIAKRKDMMKAQGAAAGQLTRMANGQAPFDLAAAKTSLQVFVDNSKTFHEQFPETSKTGDTRALPAIWEKNDEFKAKLAAFGKDAEAALANVKDVDTLKAAMGTIGPHCGGCHQTFRKT